MDRKILILEAKRVAMELMSVYLDEGNERQFILVRDMMDIIFNLTEEEKKHD